MNPIINPTTYLYMIIPGKRPSQYIFICLLNNKLFWWMCEIAVFTPSHGKPYYVLPFTLKILGLRCCLRLLSRYTLVIKLLIIFYLDAKYGSRQGSAPRGTTHRSMWNYTDEARGTGASRNIGHFRPNYQPTSIAPVARIRIATNSLF